jgi:hypothetical protein
VLFGLEMGMLVYFILPYEERKYLPVINAQTNDGPEPTTEPKVTKDTGIAKGAAREGPESPAINEPNVVNIDTSIPQHSWRHRMRFITKTDENIITLMYTPFVVLFKIPAVMYTALQYAFCLCWISVQGSINSMIFPYPPYNFGTADVAYMSLGPFIGSILGSIYGGVLSDRTVLYLGCRSHGYYEPEMRLQLCHFPAICMSGGLVMFGLALNRVSDGIEPTQPYVFLVLTPS